MREGVLGFLTASHCTPQQWGYDGSAVQQNDAGGVIGVELADPSHWTGTVKRVYLAGRPALPGERRRVRLTHRRREPGGESADRLAQRALHDHLRGLRICAVPGQPGPRTFGYFSSMGAIKANLGPLSASQ